MIDPRPLDPPEYYDSEPMATAIIDYKGNVESIAYDENNPDAFFDEIVSSVKWAIENSEPLTIKIK